MLFSGGQDSTVCLAHALDAFARVETVGFDYGQRHAVELECRQRVRAEIASAFPAWGARLGPDHVLDITSFGAIGDTALTSGAEIQMLASGLPSTFVPGRNLVFFTYAAALGYRRGLHTLVGGMCETDYSGYPDCRDATLRALEQAIRLGTEVPFVDRHAADVAVQGRDLGACAQARRRRTHRPHHRAHPHLLSRRAGQASCLGLWLRRLPGLRAPRQGLRAVAGNQRAKTHAKSRGLKQFLPGSSRPGAGGSLKQGLTGSDYRTYQLVGLLLGPACFAAMLLSPVPSGLSAAGWATAALGVWMAIWWATEAIPLFATALLPLLFLPLLGISNLNAAAAPFANPVVFLLFGGFLIALAVERWDLHRRIAFHIILRVGNRPHNLIGGVMLATGALSMWISNTATTVMMLPIAISLIGVVLPPGKDHGRDGTNFAAAMLLGVAYAATIGGMATLIGSPPNALTASYLSQNFGIKVTFAEWMAIGVPISLVLLAAAYVILTRVSLPFSSALASTEQHVVADMLREMGPMSRPEKRVAAVFAAVVAAWILSPLIGHLTGVAMSDTGIAIAGVIALCAIPADWKSRTFLLDLATARRAPFDILILFGGGLSLAEAMEVSGLTLWIGNGLSFLHGLPVVVLVAGAVLLVIFISELMSNTATAAAFLPIGGSLAIGAEASPLLIALAVGLASSSAFMLPVGTLPNALVFGTGQIPLPRMLHAGFYLNLAGAAIITIGLALAAPFL